MTADRIRKGPSPLLTTAEVADHFRVTDKTVRSMIGRGELSAHRVGNRYLVAESELDAFLARSSVSRSELPTDYSEFTLPRG